MKSILRNFILCAFGLASCNSSGNYPKQHFSFDTSYRSLPVAAPSDTTGSKPVEKVLSENHNLYLYVDDLKSVFTAKPFEYLFENEETVQGTTDSHIRGTENMQSYLRETEIPDKIIINYDLNTKKVRGIDFFLNHFSTNKIQTKHLKRLFEITDYFDADARKFILKNFHTIFYDETAFENLTPYKNVKKNLMVGFDHNLFAIRKAYKRDGYTTTSQFVYCRISFLNNANLLQP